MPSPGRVHSIRFPAGPGVRIDSHLYPGYEIPTFYDSMVAKLIVWGPDRETAIRRLLRALSEFEIDGVPTTAKFHEAVLRHPQFLEGTFNTGFIEREADYFKSCFSEIKEDYLDDAALLTAVVSLSQSVGGQLSPDTAVGPRSNRSRWRDQARHQ